jgi:hypothetical protein
MSDSEESDKKELWKGLGYTAALHCIFAAFLFGLSMFQDEGDVIMRAPLLFLGVTQAIYMVPAFVITRGKGREQLAKGLLIGAAITFLLNAACAGYLLWGVRDYLTAPH